MKDTYVELGDLVSDATSQAANAIVKQAKTEGWSDKRWKKEARKTAKDLQLNDNQYTMLLQSYQKALSGSEHKNRTNRGFVNTPRHRYAKRA